MPLACHLGLHHWVARATARPGVTVHRCTRCDRRIRTVNGRSRIKKRWVLLGTLLTSLSIWYVVIALGLTGHTRVLWAAGKVAGRIDRTAGHIDRGLRDAVGAPTNEQLP